MAANAAGLTVAPSVRIGNDPGRRASRLPLHFVVLRRTNERVIKEDEVAERCAVGDHRIVRFGRRIDGELD